MPWCKVPIIGKGTDLDPFRPDIPSGDWVAHIPSNRDGTPRLADAIVFIVNDRDVPVGATRFSVTEAHSEIRMRDPNAKPEAIRVRDTAIRTR